MELGGNRSVADVLRRLREGNERFTSGEPIYPRHGRHRRLEVATKGQRPVAIVLSCADSRVPVEIILDQGIGDIFSVRMAGNIGCNHAVASIEFGLDLAHPPLLMVMGHTQCGAVMAAVSGGDVPGQAAGIVEHIRPSVELARRMLPEARTDELTARAVELNVWQSIEDVFTASQMVRDLAAQGSLTVVGAVYDVHSGIVTWLGEHPEQEGLLK